MKMNTRRRELLGIFALAAVCLMLFVSFACGYMPKREKIVIRVATPTLFMYSALHGESTDSQRFLEKAAHEFKSKYKDADVDIEICVFDLVNEVKAVAGSFDTANAADVLFEDYFNMAAYVHTGRVVPLDDIITDDIRADIGENMWQMSEVGGKTYMMPYLVRQNVLMYRKSLFEACGLEKYIDDSKIQNWTIAEWEEILDTLAKRLPPNVYPMMMYAKNNQGDTHIMSLIRAFGSPIFNDDGQFEFQSPQSVKALAWLRSGKARGWYPPSAENLEIQDMQELFANGQLAIYLYNNASNAWLGDMKEYGFVNFPGNVTTAFVTGFEVFDNGDAAKLKAAKAFVKYVYEDEAILEYSVGNIPVSKKMMDKYADRVERLDEFVANMENVVDFVNGSPNWQGNDTSVRSVFYPKIQLLLLGAVSPEECGRQLDADCNKSLFIGWRDSHLHE